MTSWGKRAARALVAASIAAAAVALVHPAAAKSTDIASLRSRAQAVASQVTGLEHHLAGLDARRRALSAQIEHANASIGVLELKIHRAQAELDSAKQIYVQRAIDAYESSYTPELALILSAKTLPDMFRIAQAASISARDDVSALRKLQIAQANAEAAQTRIDDRKQQLLVAQERVQAVGDRIHSTIAQRRSTLHELSSRIAELEQEARREARAAAAATSATSISPSDALTKLLAPAGPAPDVPSNFVATGVSFQGVASWYGPGFEGRSTASGQIFDSSLFTCASKDLPLGTWLYVSHEGKGVVVLVNDRGPYVAGRVLDLSQAAAQAIGISGLGWVTADILVKK
jgi:peptidoglycan hydrolase CwlO-like protein